ncbi:hypothetical protein AT727_05880 [Desulfitobacterium hafniense]|uniref:Aspartate/glutamate/uridylate kinase domain-containing protein n=1 Tax=Desulfitobacterium hafniense TaxID=49338 RepID=A0A0W1JI25_DESHA|nr:hypothetical protein [Desulfitobacterium hafniense]KTE91125.1 hypothetical protein AT727_05880 [Desulfitobacterium hafniense]
MPGPILIKIGGSLIRQESGKLLRQLCNLIAGCGQKRSILIVPGGGPFADLIRAYERHWDLEEETCHFMALAAMDQYAYILRERIPGSTVDALGSLECSQSGGLPCSADSLSSSGVRILLCSHFLRQVPATALPRSWETTSDSIAAYLAKQLNCSLLVLVKSKTIEPTLLEPDIDSFFHQLLPLPMPAWFINGTDPESLQALLETGRTQGIFLPPGNCRAQIQHQSG